MPGRDGCPCRHIHRADSRPASDAGPERGAGAGAVARSVAVCARACVGLAAGGTGGGGWWAMEPAAGAGGEPEPEPERSSEERIQWLRDHGVTVRDSPLPSYVLTDKLLHGGSSSAPFSPVQSARCGAGSHSCLACLTCRWAWARRAGGDPGGAQEAAESRRGGAEQGDGRPGA